MSRHYDDIAFTETVSEVQERYGSRRFYDRKRSRGPRTDGGDGDALTDDERDYLAERDHFYLATVGATGWPYVQYRGGPPGFLEVLDDHTIGWADFRGNLPRSTGTASSTSPRATRWPSSRHRWPRCDSASTTSRTGTDDWVAEQASAPSSRAEQPSASPEGARDPLPHIRCRKSSSCSGESVRQK